MIVGPRWPKTGHVNDGRDKVRADGPTTKRIMLICDMSGRRAADVRAEALRIGAEVLELKYKEDNSMGPSGVIADETKSRKPNRAERRAAESQARKAKPAKVRGKKATTRKVSTSA